MATQALRWRCPATRWATYFATLASFWAGFSLLPAAPLNWPTWRGNPASTAYLPSVNLTFPLKKRWEKKLAEPLIATAVSDGTTFYLGDGAGVFRALEAESGAEKWHFTLKNPQTQKPSGDPIEGAAAWHQPSSTIIFGATDGWVYALATTDGQLRWKYEMPTEIKAAISLASMPGSAPPRDLVLVADFGGTVVALDAIDGKKVWSYEAGGPINGAPSVLDDAALFGGCHGTIDVLDLATGAHRRRIEIKTYLPNSLALRDGLAYAGHAGNRLEAFSIATGEKKWSYRDKDFPYFTSPALSPDTLFAGGDDKRLHAVSLDTGDSRWVFRTQGKVPSSPVILGSHVVFGSEDGSFYAVAIADGSETWHYELGGAIKASPSLAQGSNHPILAIGTENGVFAAFGHP